MGLFGSILKTVINTATTPIDIIKDVATLGGTLTDEDETYTEKKLRKLKDNVDEIQDEVDDL